MMRSETWRLMKNVLVISFAFILAFTAYSGASNLQSSINAKTGLGTVTLATIHASLIFSNLFLSAPVTKWIGIELTISLSFLTFMPYIAAQLYPRFWTMIPAGLILGLGGGPLWCAKCTYLNIVSEQHSKFSATSMGALMSRYLGIFFMIYQMKEIWGNLISSLGDNAAAVTVVNASMIPNLCGANFLPSADAGKSLLQQPQEKIQLMSGIFLSCIAGSAILVAIGVDSLKRNDADSKGPSKSLLVDTLKLMVEPDQLLLISINIFIGLEQGFFNADFTAAFVSCAIGTGTVGFVMITFGLANSLSCIICGYVVKVIGRATLLSGALLLHGALFVTLLSWRPHAGCDAVLYAVAMLWGVCDSVWMVQINAYYGTLFKGREEEAFSNFSLWEAVGYFISYVISPYFRTSTKTYVLLSTMVVGFNLLCNCGD